MGLSTTALLAGLHSRIASGQVAGVIDLTVERRTLAVKKRAASVYGIRQPGDRRFYEAAAGDRFQVRLANKLDTATLLHWHGLTPPTDQDGVPDLSQPALEAGNVYQYDFPLTRSGTFWMHSHVGLQEQQLLAAPLIVTDPAEAKLDEQPVVLMLHDFSFRSPEEIFAGLRKTNHASPGMAMDHGTGDMPGMGGMSMGQGSKGPMSGMSMPPKNGAMRMDLNDIEYDAYLANDRTLDDPEVVAVEPAGRIRLRIINGSSATNFHIDLGRLRGDLIAVDGDPIVPVSGSRFELAMAQRADIRLTLPKGPGAYPVLALREGERQRTGILLATKKAPIRKLSSMAGKAAPVVGLDLERRLRAAMPLPERSDRRTVPVKLSGDMKTYVWSMDGQMSADRPPLMVMKGERIEMALTNTTMMSHPMHLHGHHFQVAEIDGKRFAGAMRDTVLVPPQSSIVIAFDADNPGRWAFHCHNLYHMQAGMMAEVRYAT